VAVDTDERVKFQKGDDRPINTLSERIRVLNSIRYIDEVLTFNSKEELEEVYKLSRASIIVKGSEWTEAELRSRDNIPEDIEIKIYPLYKDFSTSKIIDKIKEK